MGNEIRPTRPQWWHLRQKGTMAQSWPRDQWYKPHNDGLRGMVQSPECRLREQRYKASNKCHTIRGLRAMVMAKRENTRLLE